MSKSFTDIERKNIREALISQCQISWAKFGYKKTSIDELCAKTGISKGAFYLFFSSKEDLFCETIETVQNRLIALMEKTVSDEPSKEGFAKALKILYEEYDKNSFLLDVNSPDFIAFVNKLPDDRLKRQELTSANSFHKLIEMANLKLKVDEQKAFATLNALLSLASFKGREKLGYSHAEVFNFLLDCVIKEIFE